MNSNILPPRRAGSCIDSSSDPSVSTAYCGAQGLINDREAEPPLGRLGRVFEDIGVRGSVSLAPTPTSREGLGSRFLATFSAASPTAAALAHSSSVVHSRAKSWSAYVPTFTPTTTTTTIADLPASNNSSNQQSKVFSDLFSGESAPVKLGVPTSPVKEPDGPQLESVMDYRPTFTDRPSYRRRESTMSMKNLTSNVSKTSWFNRKQTQPAATPHTPDEILKLDINSTLFPNGPVDQLSPQAFNDLFLNATALLQRMQAAYKEKVDYISSIQPEIDAQKEEVEEAQIRSEHLKLQLEDIGRQNQEQRLVNEELIVQLSQEKMKLQEARAANKTVRLVRRDTIGAEADEMTDEEGHRRRKRGSAASADDSGFESDADTASIFSAAVDTPLARPRLPQFTSIVTSFEDRPSYTRTSTMSQQSTGGATLIPDLRRQGRDVSAWATVEALRHENATLQKKVENMEESLQDCIAMINVATGL